MIQRLRAGFARTALGFAILIWGFGYLLVDIVAAMLGRSMPGVNLLASLPLFALGVSLTLALETLRVWLRRLPVGARAAIMVAAIMAAAGVQALFDLYWFRFLSLTIMPDWQEWTLQVTAQRLFTAGILYLWAFCLALALLWAGRASRAAEANMARAAEAEAAAAKAQSAALRLQLNPHFLFNTMNSISSLVGLDRKHEAEEMIERLCEFLRASLNADPMEDVPLAQEIDAIDAYLSIEATRFGERLNIDIDIAPETINAQVPNFILQPLVENAIKHGVSVIKGPADLSVTAVREGADLVLSVINNSESAATGGEAIPSKQSTGIGLSNSRQRLLHRYGEGAQLVTGPTDGGYRAVIRLPFVQAVS